MKCFYHADLDGRCSAFWVKYYKKWSNNDDFIEMNYNKEFPMDIISPEEEVWIVDYSIQTDEMLKLLEKTKDVTWIDHHKTAIEKYKDFQFEIKGVRRDGVAACVLTRKFLFPNEKVPYFTELIGDRDIWKFLFGADTKNFYYGLLVENTSLDSPLWEYLLFGNGVVEEVINRGVLIQQYRFQFSNEYMKSWSFETQIDGHSCLAVNIGTVGSEFFGNADKYDILSSFVFDGKKWVVSVYSSKVDVSEVARKRGGGGHVAASGYVSTEFPFKLP
jgi:oligoribonuclease NrnB/cAMP/cGMP phosphodiesterase (DHH superfamily)